MRVVFCGTPEIAVPSLRALCGIAEVVGVVSQPDRPSGRGMKLTAPPVKVEALSRGLEVFQPTKVRDGTLARWMGDRNADFALVIAYGRILTKETLAAPERGCLNLHASLLPDYRGAAPIQRALMDGRDETGICLMQMDEGMDTGPVLARRALSIQADDDAGSLAQRLSILAAEVTREELPRFMNGELSATPQDHHLASYAPPLTHEETWLDFGRPASRLTHTVRGLAPRPGAVCLIPGDHPKRLKVLKARVSENHARLRPGEIGTEADGLLIGTADGALHVLQGQLEGKKAQSGSELLRGRAVQPGLILATGPLAAK